MKHSILTYGCFCFALHSTTFSTATVKSPNSRPPATTSRYSNWRSLSLLANAFLLLTTRAHNFPNHIRQKVVVFFRPHHCPPDGVRPRLSQKSKSPDCGNRRYTVWVRNYHRVKKGHHHQPQQRSWKQEQNHVSPIRSCHKG